MIGKPDFTTPLDAAADASATNMTAPFGVALTGGGHLLVSDLAFNRVLLFLKPQGGDFANGMAAGTVIGQPDFLSKAAGSDSNRMSGPRHISTDSSDHLFVCDTGNNRIQAFSDATQLGPDAIAAFSLTNLSSPQGVFASPVTGEIWVANSGGSTLYRYPRFDVLQAPGSQFQPDFAIASGAAFERPMALTVDAFSNLLVAYSTNRVGFYFPAMTPVNAAHYLPRLAPGAFTALYPLGGTFGNQTVLAPGLPLPTELADIQVLVNGQAAPLSFVTPGQINFVMPMSAPTSGSVELQVVRKSLGQVLAVGCAALRVGTNTDGTPRYACVGPGPDGCGVAGALRRAGLFPRHGPDCRPERETRWHGLRNQFTGQSSLAQSFCGTLRHGAGIHSQRAARRGHARQQPALLDAGQTARHRQHS